MDLSLEHSKLQSAFPKLKIQFVRGLGLITLAQEHVQQEFPKRAIAFALYSGKVNLIGRGLDGGDHVTARVHNVDWVFHKRQRGRNSANREPRDGGKGVAAGLAGSRR